MKLILPLISIALNIWLALTVVRLENVHYCRLVGVCVDEEQASI